MNAMTAIPRNTALLDRLPEVRGSYTSGAPLKDLTWFRVGGPAEVLFRPADLDDLTGFLSSRPADVPVTVIGAGANLLVRDGGVRGVVVRLGRGFGKIADDPRGLRAGAGCSNVSVALRARDRALAGYEFLRGIPGSIGGALRMNAGAYGQEMKDVVLSARSVDGDGRLHEFQAGELGYGYRHCGLGSDHVFVDAIMRAEPGDRDAIARRMDEISRERQTTQPVKSATGGSTFANPDGAKAWELIDRAGCRGLRIGGAQVSEQHTNFMINLGDATAADLETLGETVRDRVREKFGIELRWEIRRIGEPGEAPA